MFNQEQTIQTICDNQQGKSDCTTFMRNIAKTGVHFYETTLNGDRKRVAYIGSGGNYEEETFIKTSSDISREVFYEIKFELKNEFKKNGLFGFFKGRIYWCRPVTGFGSRRRGRRAIFPTVPFYVLRGPQIESATSR